MRKPRISKFSGPLYCEFCGDLLPPRYKVCCAKQECRDLRSKKYQISYAEHSGKKIKPLLLKESNGKEIFPVTCKCPSCKEQYIKKMKYRQPLHHDGKPIIQYLYCKDCDHKRFLPDSE